MKKRRAVRAAVHTGEQREGAYRASITEPVMRPVMLSG